jgi:Ca2+-binding EF-hand superfamily protein
VLGWLLVLGTAMGFSQSEEQARVLLTQFDSNEDGLVTEQELQGHFARHHRSYFVAKAEAAIPTADIQSVDEQTKYWGGVVKHLDTNGDGMISKGELPTDHHLATEFRQADHSADGFLTANELSRHQETASVTKHLVKDAASNLLAVADDSRDGSLSVGEIDRHLHAFMKLEL